MGRFLGKEMACVQLPALGSRRKAAPPHAQKIGLGSSQIEIAPKQQSRAINGPAGSQIGLVITTVNRRTGAVILAEGVDAGRLIGGLMVALQRARKRRKIAALVPFRHEAIDIGFRPFQDLVFGLRRGAGEERPMGRRGLAGFDHAPDMEGWKDIQQREPGHAARVIERETAGEAPAPVMPGNRRLRRIEMVEYREKILRHHALGVFRAILAARRNGPAIAAQIGQDHPMRAGEHRGHMPPASMGLRKAVQQNERCAGPAGAHEQLPLRTADPVAFESGEKIAWHAPF